MGKYDTRYGPPVRQWLDLPEDSIGSAIRDVLNEGQVPMQHQVFDTTPSDKPGCINLFLHDSRKKPIKNCRSIW